MGLGTPANPGARGVVPGPLPQHVTELLTDWEGDQAALQALIPMLYDELRRTAHRYLGREKA